MNMEAIQGDIDTSAQPLIDADPPKPATAADDKKTDATPADGAEVKKPDTPEQQEAQKESRRQRAARRDRDAVVAAQTEARLLREELAKRDVKAAPVSGEPKREDFEDYETYLRAATKYDAKQEAEATLKADREANQSKSAQTRQSEAHQATAKAWGEREAVVIKANPDYEESVTPYVDADLGQLSDGARRLIVDSDVGPQVLHHLATHADVHDRIAKLSPLRQVVELGKLEDSLQPKGDADTRGEEDPPKAEGKRISDAPAPIRPVSGGGSSSGGTITEKSSQADVRAWMAKSGSKWVRPNT